MPQESARELATRIERAVHLVRSSPYIPKAAEPSAPQWAFIASKETECAYMGAVGGGKSHALLASALMYVHVPGYSALLIRKNFPELSQPGGLMSMANEWLSGTDATKRDGGKVWEFPSGATLRFGHIESPQDWTRYQGGEYQFIGIDELPQLEYEIWENLKSRLRRSTVMHPELADVPDRIRGTGNPGGRHAKTWKEYFISNEEGVRVSLPDRLFIFSKMTDNPSLDVERYSKILSELDPLRRAQMRDGDFDVLPVGVLFAAENFVVVEGKISGPAHRVRSWDLAGSAKKTSDYCAGVLMARDKNSGIYRIEHVVHGKFEPGPLEAMMRQTAELDGHNVPILIEEERAGAGKLVLSNFRRTVLKGFSVRAARPVGDKVARAGLFSALVDRNEMELTRAKWNEQFTQECVSFPTAAHDDRVDSASQACHYLARLPVRRNGSGETAPSGAGGYGSGETAPGALSRGGVPAAGRGIQVGGYPPGRGPGSSIRRDPWAGGVRGRIL